MTLQKFGQALLAIALCVPFAASANCEKATAMLGQLQPLVDAEASARDALVMLRRTAQDWKNLLLRGSDIAQRKTMQGRFDEHGKNYGEILQALKKQLASRPPELERVAAIDRERAVMLQRFDAALSRHGVATIEAGLAADQEVQGADVVSLRNLEQLTESLTTTRTTMFRDLRQALEQCGK